MRAILTFHSIDDSGSIISYPTKSFALLLQKLSDEQIPIYDIQTLLNPEIKNGVALTFDDGMRSVYKNALPILKIYNAHAHIFVTTAAINNNVLWPQQPVGIPRFEMLNWDEISELQHVGHTIETHTTTHPDMRTLTPEQMRVECELADDEIKQKTGQRPSLFAYPFGYHNQAVREFARGRYTATVTTELRSLSCHEDSAALPRLDSYYFQMPWAIQHLNSFPLKTYISFRSIARTLSGSQCPADA